jgi:hypothetical protein
MLRRLRSLIRRKPKSPPRNNRKSPARKSPSPARQRQMKAPPRPARYNGAMVRIPGTMMAVPPNVYKQYLEYKRLLRNGYSNNAARRASNWYM